MEGQSAAWANMRAWEAKALKKARDEAGAALTAATTAEKERDEQRLRADTAEDRVRELTGERDEAKTRADEEAGAVKWWAGKAEEADALRYAAEDEKQKAEKRVRELEGERQQKVPDPPARPWKDLSDDELLNHWDGASRRRHRAAATDEQKADARQKIVELHAEARHRDTTLETLHAEREERKRREAEQAAAQAEEAGAKAQAADAARRADLLKDNPYAETPQGELRKGYRDDVATIEMHQVILNRARARKVWPESEEKIAEAGTRQKQRSAVAEAKGWNIGQPPRTQSNTQRDGGIGD